MNEMTSNRTVYPHASDTGFRIKVVGVGGAGSNALDRLVLEGSVNVDLVACNTDVQALAASVATQKIQLGRQVTRGLGAGGDPELGFSAAEEASSEIRAIVEGVPLVIVCTGLGGGTGSGAAPMIVKTAREQNSLVLVCATLPFSFEGKRRGQQAQEALRAIQQYADAVMCFENDRMGELILPEAGIHEAFAGADQIISQSVRAIIDLVNRRGLIHLGFDDLLSALRSHDSRCLFGYGEAGGSARGHAVVEVLQGDLRLGFGGEGDGEPDECGERGGDEHEPGESVRVVRIERLEEEGGVEAVQKRDDGEAEARLEREGDGGGGGHGGELGPGVDAPPVPAQDEDEPGARAEREQELPGRGDRGAVGLHVVRRAGRT